MECFVYRVAKDADLTGFVDVYRVVYDPVRGRLKSFNGAVFGDFEGLRQVWPIFLKNGQG